MIDRNLTVPYNFHCYKDPPEDIEGVWKKLSMFRQGFSSGINLYFDLDVVIQKNIDFLFDNIHDNLTLVKCFWKDNNDYIEYGKTLDRQLRYNMQYNSSVMLWKGDSLSYIWDYFMKDPEYYMNNYLGIDRFLFHEGFKLNHFQKGKIYSRLYGKDIESYYDDYDVIDGRGCYYYPDYSICLLNGDTDERHYDILKNYWL